MQKHQKVVGSIISGYPARLSTSYIYEVESPSGYPVSPDSATLWCFCVYICDFSSSRTFQKLQIEIWVDYIILSKFWTFGQHLLTSRSTFISLKWLVRVKMVIICPQKVFPNVAKKLFHSIWCNFASRIRKNACDTAFESSGSILFRSNIH